MGAGTGLEALTAASLGAERVIACDVNRMSLELLSDAAHGAGLGDLVETRVFDLCIGDPLPAADVAIFSDVLYTRDLSEHVARCCSEVLMRDVADGSLGWLLLTDSQRFHSDSFLADLNARRRGKPPLQWQRTRVERFTGSGILLEEDQTYDTDVAFLDHVWEASRLPTSKHVSG